MILKGSQRSGAKPLAVHLLNERDNDHVELFELRGFVSDHLVGALRETEAIAKGTRCTQYMFSLSLNPPMGAVVGEEQFRQAADEAEKRLGLEGQPRAIVIHEKEGRRHAHVVWSRIDPETMRAINIAHYKYKLTALTKELYLQHDWPLPDGLKHAGGKSPLNFTLDEWQQARRLDIDPREIKQIFREAWKQSDSLRAFGNALAERGFFLAQGDRRGFVAVDVHGETFAVARWVGVKTKDVTARLGEPAQLPRVDAVRGYVAGLVTDKLRRFIADVKCNHDRDFSTLRSEMDAMRRAHRAERATLRTKQAERWQAETAARAARLRTGFAGLIDKITGKAKALREENTREAISGIARDRQQRDTLAVAQMRERSALQERITTLRMQHLKNRKLLTREVVRSMRAAQLQQDAEIERRKAAPEPHPSRFRGPSPDR
jgi:hypothetical protein